MLYEGESVTHRFDCNTVGPAPLASGYGSRTLTHSVAYVLEGSKHNASALSSMSEKIHIHNGENDLRGLSKTQVGVPETSDNANGMPNGSCFTGSGPTQRSDANVCGTQILHFTKAYPGHRISIN